jgi:hypothetical protein
MATLGQNLVRPSEYLSPRAQANLQQSSEQESEPSGERIGGLHHRLGRPLLTFRRGAGLELVITAHSQN